MKKRPARITDSCTIVPLPSEAARCYLYYQHNISPNDEEELVLVRVNDPEAFRRYLCDEENHLHPRPGGDRVEIPATEDRHASWWSEYIKEVIYDTGSAALCDHIGAAARMEQPYYFFDATPERTRDAWIARSQTAEWHLLNEWQEEKQE